MQAWPTRRRRAGALPAELPETERELAAETRWEQWRYGAHWLKRLRAAAGRSDRFIVISPHDGDEAARLLDIKGEQVTWISNGVDTELFDRQPIEPPSASPAGASGW